MFEGMQNASKPLPTIDGFVTQLLDGLDVYDAKIAVQSEPDRVLSLALGNLARIAHGKPFEAMIC